MKIKIFLMSLLMSLTMISQAAITELNPEDIADKKKVIDFLKILAVIKDVDGTINDNKITYNEKKYAKIDVDEKLTGLQPMVEKLSESPKQTFVKVGDFYLYVLDTKSKAYEQAQKTMAVEAYPSEINLTEYDPSKSEIEKVMYISYIGSLALIGKDVNQKSIQLTSEDKDKLYEMKKGASSGMSKVLNYTVCFDGQVIGLAGASVMFNGVRYYITEKEKCDKTKEIKESEEFPSKVTLINYDENMSELEKVGYISYLSALVELGKDISQKEIELTEEDYDIFAKRNETYKEEIKRGLDYTVCFDHQLKGDPLFSVNFHSVNYHIIKKKECNKLK